MNREEATYRRLHPSLLKKYPNQYVAINGSELVDHDKNQVELYLRVKSHYPDEFVWIAPVRPEPEEIYIMRSPRFNEGEIESIKRTDLEVENGEHYSMSEIFGDE